MRSGWWSGTLLVVGLLFSPASRSDAQTPPSAGVSLELAQHRAATITDLRYDVLFRLPGDTARDVTGEVTIRFVRDDDGPIVLDFASPSDVRTVRVGGRAVAWEAATTHLVLPDSAVPAGPVSVNVTFVAGDGPLNRRGEFLYSLFVPDRAHEAFPGFDQPDLKARYRLRLSVPQDWTAVANGAEVRRRQDGDQVLYTFRETEPLPTYLFAFVAGRFDVETAVREGRTLRIVHRETDREKVARNRDAIFDLHASALAWLEEYTGIPYPFGKFDIVAIPSFQYNGMEHPGAVLYRASSLFLEESATRNEELGRASLVAHETAHMWFGDLVTMRWFSDVWMKEVFANFMAAKIVNPSFPELNHELRFLLAHYPAAYSVDRTDGANPIRQPLENLSDAGALYGAIIYQKAPIVMRQLERLTGEAPFREAVRDYLDAHRFGNAGWPALVAALDRVAELDVAAWSRVWIEEPGRPRIDVERSRTGALTLRPEDPAGRGRVWPQQIGVARLDRRAGEPRPGATPAAGAPLGEPLVVGATDRREVTLGAEPVPLTLDGQGGILLPNADGLGYGLFRLDRASRVRLLESLPYIADPVARAAAWVDLYELMLEGDVSPAALFETGMRAVRIEQDELVAEQLVGDLQDIYWRSLCPSRRAASASRLESLLWGRVRAAADAPTRATYFNGWRAVATSPAAIERMEAVWRGEEPVPGLPLSERDRTRLALELAVRGVDGAEAILDAQESAIENPDRRARFAFVRRAVSPDVAVRDAFFASLANVENRTREEWVVTALSLLHHPLRADASLRYIRPALDLLEEVKETGDIFFPTGWLAATLGGHASPDAAAVVRTFLAEHPDYPPRLRGKLLQEADPLFRVATRCTALPGRRRLPPDR